MQQLSPLQFQKQLRFHEARPLLEILDRCAGRVGLCVDTDNAEAPDKYETLALLLPRATSMHFHFKPADPSCPPASPVDTTDLLCVVQLMQEAHFSGPISLITSGTQEEWAIVGRLQAALAPHLPEG